MEMHGGAYGVCTGCGRVCTMGCVWGIHNGVCVWGIHNGVCMGVHNGAHVAVRCAQWGLHHRGVKGVIGMCRGVYNAGVWGMHSGAE